MWRFDVTDETPVIAKPYTHVEAADHALICQYSNRHDLLLAELRPGLRRSSTTPTPKALAAFEGVKTEYSRDDFNAHRGEDVLEFFMHLILTHKQRLAAEWKTFGKSCELSPLVYDTGIGYKPRGCWPRPSPRRAMRWATTRPTARSAAASTRRDTGRNT